MDFIQYHDMVSQIMTKPPPCLIFAANSPCRTLVMVFAKLKLFWKSEAGWNTIHQTKWFFSFIRALYFISLPPPPPFFLTAFCSLTIGFWIAAHPEKLCLWTSCRNVCLLTSFVSVIFISAATFEAVVFLFFYYIPFQ